MSVSHFWCFFLSLSYTPSFPENKIFQSFTFIKSIINVCNLFFNILSNKYPPIKFNQFNLKSIQKYLKKSYFWEHDFISCALHSFSVFNVAFPWAYPLVEQTLITCCLILICCEKLMTLFGYFRFKELLIMVDTCQAATLFNQVHLSLTLVSSLYFEERTFS